MPRLTVDEQTWMSAGWIRQHLGVGESALLRYVAFGKVAVIALRGNQPKYSVEDVRVCLKETENEKGVRIGNNVATAGK